jgi:hypothetical protein
MHVIHEEWTFSPFKTTVLSHRATLHSTELDPNDNGALSKQRAVMQRTLDKGVTTLRVCRLPFNR